MGGNRRGDEDEPGRGGQVLQDCPECGSRFAVAPTGRPPRYCSNACRQHAYRSRRSPFPSEMTLRNTWVRAQEKRPIMPDGRPASSTNPATWSPFAAVRHGAGNGYGIMLGGGLGCYDLDHVDDEYAVRFMRTIVEPIVYAERSRSGEGVHIFVRAEESAGWKRIIGGKSVERYTRARFILVTGNSFVTH